MLHGHFFIGSWWGKNPMCLFPDFCLVPTSSLTFSCSSSLSFWDYPEAFNLRWELAIGIATECQSSSSFLSSAANAYIYFFLTLLLIPNYFSRRKVTLFGDAALCRLQERGWPDSRNKKKREQTSSSGVTLNYCVAHYNRLDLQMCWIIPWQKANWVLWLTVSSKCSFSHGKVWELFSVCK